MTSLSRCALLALCTVAGGVAAQAPAPEPRRPVTLTLGPTGGQRATQEIVEAERAFAKLGREKGIQASFIATFAPDGLTFEPGPTRVVEEYPKQPVSTSQLLWGPDEAGASADGSMGFTSGPYILRKGGAPADDPGRHGRFLTVWRRQPDGQWKIALDLGGSGGFRAEIPAASSEVAVRFTGFAHPRPAVAQREAGVVQSAFFRALESGDWKELRKHLHDQFQVFWVPGEGFQHAARIADEAWPSLAPKGSQFEVTAAAAAESGDFAYAHGKIVLGGKADGYWVSIWLREPQSDQWRIVRLVRNKAE